jgi:hypothetical protein
LKKNIFCIKQKRHVFASAHKMRIRFHKIACTYINNSKRDLLPLPATDVQNAKRMEKSSCEKCMKTARILLDSAGFMLLRTHRLALLLSLVGY